MRQSFPTRPLAHQTRPLAHQARPLARRLWPRSHHLRLRTRHSALGATALMCALFATSAPVRANDSAAELGAGGLVFVKSEGVVMEREELTISQSKVQVAYVFRNDSRADVDTRVAFPVPEWDEEDEGDLELDRKGKNPMGFSVIVDGKPVRFETERKRTGTKVKVTHHWQQRFPAGKRVTVRHAYTPVAGVFFGPEQGNPLPELDEHLTKDFCVGPALLAGMKRKPLVLRSVRYILTTGANWKGPIETFKLVLEKRVPGDKISVCLPDTRRLDARRFVVERSNFTPTEDLRILFVPRT